MRGCGRCGHRWHDGACSDVHAPSCDCPDGRQIRAARPTKGERLVFGVHRQKPDDAETAPAWDPDEIELARTAKLRGRLRA